jgi:hypothetical protein
MFFIFGTGNTITAPADQLQKSGFLRSPAPAVAGCYFASKRPKDDARRDLCANNSAFKQ